MSEWVGGWVSEWLIDWIKEWRSNTINMFGSYIQFVDLFIKNSIKNNWKDFKLFSLILLIKKVLILYSIAHYSDMLVTNTNTGNEPVVSHWTNSAAVMFLSFDNQWEEIWKTTFLIKAISTLIWWWAEIKSNGQSFKVNLRELRQNRFNAAQLLHYLFMQ